MASPDGYEAAEEKEISAGTSSMTTESAKLLSQVERLSNKLQQNAKEHSAQVSKLLDEMVILRDRLRAGEDSSQRYALQGTLKTFYWRRVEWRLENVSKLIDKNPRGVSEMSPYFTIMGVEGLRLEFFPNGRAIPTARDGFCALFLWCPPGVTVSYTMQVGSHCGNANQDKFESRIGNGHSNFCLLAPQIAPDDSLVVAMNILDFAYEQECSFTEPPHSDMTLRFFTESPEAAICREASVLHNREVSVLKFIVKDVRRRAREVDKGQAICSPLFSIMGVRNALLEFYPNGLQDAKEGYCGLYMRCAKNTELLLTLFVGKCRKGPIKAEFNGSVAKGLPEFCKLEDQLLDGQEDLEVGVIVKSNLSEEERALTTLIL